MRQKASVSKIFFLGLVCAALPGGAAHAGPPADRDAVGVSLISQSTAGVTGSQPSYHSSVSGDGRYVAFTSEAPLVTGELSEDRHLFVRDLLTRTTILIDQSTEGVPGNNYVHKSSISADGRYVVFGSAASNLVPGDTNAKPDIFLRDIVAGTTALVSANLHGGPADGNSDYPLISNDGRFAAFSSYATNLVSQAVRPKLQAYVRNLATGKTFLASPGLDGGGADNGTWPLAVSDGGRYLTLGSGALNLVPDDPPDLVIDVYWTDRVADETVKIDVPYDGDGSANGDSIGADMSADGSVVVFASVADNLVPKDTDHKSDTFIYDVASGALDFLSKKKDGQSVPGYDFDASISPDGNYVTFSVQRGNKYVHGIGKCHYNTVVEDLATHATTMAAVVHGMCERRPGGSTSSTVSDTGYVAFETNAHLRPRDAAELNSDIYGIQSF